MNYLFIDTSKKFLVTALKYEGVQYYCKENVPLQASISLINAIDNILKKANCTIDKLDTMGVVVGPGSFTGIRIGVAALKGLAFCSKINIAPVNSLCLKAYNNKGKTVLAIVPCVGGWYYIAVYDGDGYELLKPCAIKQDQLLTFINSIDEQIVVVGGDAVIQGYQMPKNVIVDTTEDCQASVFALMDDIIQKKEFVSIDGLVPLYLRKPQAEGG